MGVFDEVPLSPKLRGDRKHGRVPDFQMSRARPRVAIIATLDTKREETEYFMASLSALGMDCKCVDSSFGPTFSSVAGGSKMKAMEMAVEKVCSELGMIDADGIDAVVGLGGGTGSQVAATAIARTLPGTPSALVTTLASDPRSLAACSGMILIPTIVDIFGLNPILRNRLETAASVVAGLARNKMKAKSRLSGDSVAMTALGVTADAASRIASRIRSAGFEVTVFHANGYGGNALADQAGKGTFVGVVDCTLHELTGLAFDSRTSVRRDRISALGGIPRVVLPGGVNFFSRELRKCPAGDLEGRQVFLHSPAFTHVGLVPGEMARVGRLLAEELLRAPELTAVVLPMGGFSSEDRPGGALENPDGRVAFADELTRHARHAIEILRLDSHLDNETTASAVAGKLRELMNEVVQSEGR